MDLAVQKLRAAFESGRQFGVWIHVTPEFVGLRGVEGFEEIVSPRERR